MPKTYFCKKLSYGGFECGETDPSKFPKGRYSECKECKNRYTRSYFHDKKYEDIQKKVETIDPDMQVRSIVEDTILRSPLINGISVKKSLDQNEESISEVLTHLGEKITLLQQHIQLLYQENKLLRGEIEFLKK